MLKAIVTAVNPSVIPGEVKQHRQNLKHSLVAHRIPCLQSRTPKRLYSIRICAQKQTDKESSKSVPNTPPSRQTSTSSSDSDFGEEAEVAFQVFNLQAYTQRWSVPWGAKETLGGMALWAGSFVAVGLAALPLLRAYAGPEGFASLSQYDKAVFALINQILETGAGLGVIWFIVSSFQPLPPDVLKISLKDPFKKPDGWLAWALLGVVLSPAFVYLASVLVETFGKDDVTSRGTADAVSQIISLDGSTFSALFATTAILAPLLEETVFRGFLLTSLTKFMPTPAAVILSSLAFGLVHLSPRDFPQLTALGILLGFTYVRSKNLLSPMIIHGTWNGAVLSVLFALKAAGYDLNDVIHGGL